ncbi:MAG: hypothetical protein IJ124_05120 [Clostridia bacterium]|nr:hypothetical protein [Clostridia bacterium]MBQ8708114.1 hypothetical protein [Succinivibrionaceae bacterium]MBQ8708160.1 hypothetical protein [Succinivibrionaceae bacterium]
MNLQTVRVVCEELGISETRVRRAIADGQLEVLMLGSRTLVDLDTAREILPPIVKRSTIQDVMRETGLCESAIRRGVREGWLPFDKVGKQYVFDLDAVVEAIKKQMKKQR